MYILIKKLSSVAVVLTIIGFSGVGSFWDISAEIKSLPLVSTILNNDGWVNGLMFSSAVYMVNYQMSELNRGLIVRKIRHKEFSLHHQENVNFIIREIKKVDGELFFISILFYFFLVYFLVFFIYNSTLIPGGFVLDFFPHSDKYILEVYTLDVKENEDASRVFVVILNKLPLSVSNITGFVSQYSPFPSGTLERYVDIEKNRITFFLPDEPVFIFNSMWSLLWLAICLGGVLFTFEDYSNYLFKIRVGKIFSKRLVKYKVDRLESFSSKYNFKNRCVRDGVIKILSFFND